MRCRLSLDSKLCDPLLRAPLGVTTWSTAWETLAEWVQYVNTKSSSDACNAYNSYMHLSAESCYWLGMQCRRSTYFHQSQVWHYELYLWHNVWIAYTSVCMKDSIPKSHRERWKFAGTLCVLPPVYMYMYTNAQLSCCVPRHGGSYNPHGHG